MTIASFARSRFVVASAIAAGLLATASAVSAEPAACLSPDPSQWPAPSKPYFMVVLDNSGSMGSSVAATNSCGYQNNRIGHARCAVQNTIKAFSGEVNFGLATYAWQLSCPANAGTCQNCTAASGCFTNPGCTANYSPNDDNFCGPLTNDPNMNPALNASFPGTTTLHAGGFVAVDMLQDHYWQNPPAASNVSQLLALFDNNCGNGEIGSNSNTPLGGVLFNMNQYFAGSYVDPFTGTMHTTPIGPATFNGNPAERACRSINVILITDGDETCDAYNTGTYPNFEGLASFEAGRLLNPGVTVSGQNFAIKTYVIGFIGATTSALDNIANAGGTNKSLVASNETQLSQALAGIVGGSVKPESCNNTDDNCNGCTDEGFIHYCDVGQTCCAWNTGAQRTTCLNNYLASITPAKPKGDTTLLPCTTVAQAQQPANWLCYNPGEACDGVDNNCELSNGMGTIDEGVLKCGNPLHCPQPEICNGLDDNCNGQVDEGGVCAACKPTPEVCDGCDNDCDGKTDNGIMPVPCGLTGPGEPPNCAGTLSCKPPQNVTPGGCVAGGGWGVCSNSPQPEVCDNLDNDCNGIVDDNIPSVPCVPPNAPPNLNYGPNSQCKMGHTVCTNGMTQCVGWVGPSAEICDGIDNNCDGQIDNGNLPGVGAACGINQPPCKPGVTACVNGSIVCQGGVMPQPEVCDGIDNNCNGAIDEQPLADAPPQGMNGCWDLPGNCCTFKNLSWCPPPGGTCNGVGTLTAPCLQGSLTCVAGGWVCKGPKDPSPEVCDGIDNNCNGIVDDGVMNVGGVCGSNVGECKQGILVCMAGMLNCMGAVGPTMEICDGKDNDCDGVIDNGIPTGGPCTPPYDMNQYPGPRDKGQCKPGILECNGMGGTVCVGGVGPSPEVCDGLDNDCDGQVDEVGPAPDGIDGSPNPMGMGNVGDACGSNKGECKQGTLQCVQGQVQCLGGQAGQPETCDCKDNDCDGVIDNPNPGGMPPLCAMGSDCVKGMAGCQCAQPCAGEIPCPPGQKCELVTSPSTGQTLGKYCTQDFCGDCSSQTKKDPNGKVLCAPAGSPPDANCVTPPVCSCGGQMGCIDPCSVITCNPGTVCKAVLDKLGHSSGMCVVDNCWNVPCAGCDKACNLGSCTKNPCADPNACKPGQECKPSPDFTKPICVDSCADVTCKKGEACKDGKCAKTCDPACPMDQVCDDSQNPPTCVPNACPMGGCSDGSCCDGVTGKCGQNCPCDGVICPTGQVCQNGQCEHQMGTGGAGGGSSTGSTGTGMTSTSSGSSTGSSGGHGGASANGVWGLATGGGGCSCETSEPSSLLDARLALFFAAIVIAKRRRRDREDARASEVKS